MQTSTNILNKISWLDIMGFCGWLFQSWGGWGGYTYAILETPTDWVSLSEDWLTITRNSFNPWRLDGAKSSVAVSSGKWYMEFEYLNSISSSRIWAWVAWSIINIGSDSYPWKDEYGISILPEYPLAAWFTTAYYEVYPYGSQAVSASWTIVGMLLDMDSHTISYTVNWATYPTVLSGFTWSFEVWVSHLNNWKSVRCNFGQTPFVYPVPTWFNAGLYTE